MIRVLQRLLGRLSGASSAPGDAARERMKELPVSSRPHWQDRDVAQPEVFDPALLHYRNAFRLGEPTFEDPRRALLFRLARRRAMDHLLRIVVESPWADHLVLRGSLVLKAW